MIVYCEYCESWSAEHKLMKRLLEEGNYNRAVRPPGWADAGKLKLEISRFSN